MSYSLSRTQIRQLIVVMSAIQNVAHRFCAASEYHWCESDIVVSQFATAKTISDYVFRAISKTNIAFLKASDQEYESSMISVWNDDPFDGDSKGSNFFIDEVPIRAVGIVNQTVLRTTHRLVKSNSVATGATKRAYFESIASCVTEGDFEGSRFIEIDLGVSTNQQPLKLNLSLQSDADIELISDVLMKLDMAITDWFHTDYLRYGVTELDGEWATNMSGEDSGISEKKQELSRGKMGCIEWGMF